MPARKRLERALFEIIEICLHLSDGWASTVTFTTLGFGDITLDENWRLLSSFEAANGLLMFGWSTALIFAAVQWVYAGRKYGGPV